MSTFLAKKLGLVKGFIFNNLCLIHLLPKDKTCVNNATLTLICVPSANWSIASFALKMIPLLG